MELLCFELELVSLELDPLIEPVPHVELAPLEEIPPQINFILLLPNSLINVKVITEEVLKYVCAMCHYNKG